MGKNSVQVVIGTTVQFVADALKALLGAQFAVPVRAKEPAAAQPAARQHRWVTPEDLIFLNQKSENHFVYVITDPTGIHARPAAEMAGIAQRYGCDIIIEANGKSASAKSVVGLMALGAVQGTRLTCSASGMDSAQAIRALSDFMREKL